MNLSAWLSYLETLHPKEIDLGLDRVAHVAKELELDFSSKTVINIAGTNGKGSTSCFLAKLLQKAGKSVGLYSSPHILEYNERILVNGKAVEDAVLCHAFALIEQARGDISLTYFEFGTLAALRVFVESELDYLVLEVGLGGRLDAVNIVDADLSIITNIALDHTEWLGETREQIAFEKAGIIRAGCPVIFGENDMPQSLAAEIASKQAKLYQSGKAFNAKLENNVWHWQGENINGEEINFQIKPPPASMLSFYSENAAMSLQAFLLLGMDISRALLEKAFTQAALTGRFQIIHRGYTLVLDVAHNPHAAAFLCQNIKHCFPARKVHMLVGMLSDKDVQKTLNALGGITSTWYLASLQNSRGSDSNMLYNALGQAVQSQAFRFDSVQSAFHEAEKNIQPDELLVVTGSFYTVADVLEMI
jgi:dihydrofolate synthase/folylpolyglutamate synthase